MARARAELSAKGGNDSLKWKISGGQMRTLSLALTPVFIPMLCVAINNTSSTSAKPMLTSRRRGFPDRSSAHRVGRDGRAVLADVVSARDLRSFYLPDFEQPVFLSGRPGPNTILVKLTPNWCGYRCQATTTGSASRVRSSTRYPETPGCSARSSRKILLKTVTGVVVCPGWWEGGICRLLLSKPRRCPDFLSDRGKF